MNVLAKTVVVAGLIGFGVELAGGDAMALFLPAKNVVSDLTTTGADTLEENGPNISRGVAATADAFRAGAAEVGAALPTTTTTAVQP